MINVGLVGFGLSGRYLQAPFFELSNFYNLKTIVTSQSIPVDLFPETKRVDNFEDLIEDNNINMISICSPSSTHYKYAKKSLLAGKHVLIEKPITATAIEAKELMELARSKNLVLYVFQNRRFDSDFLTVQSVIKSGVLGQIFSYEAHFDRYKPLLNSKKWKEMQAPANGILYDLGSHLIDQAVALFGKPKHINGQVFTQREGSTIDDAFDIRLDFDKIKVTLKASLMVKDQGPKYAIHGTLGSFTKYGLDVQEDHLVAGLWPNNINFGIEPIEQKGSIKTNINGVEITGKIDTLQGSWVTLFNDLANCITTNNQPIIEHQEVLDQLNIIESVKST